MLTTQGGGAACPALASAIAGAAAAAAAFQRGRSFPFEGGKRFTRQAGRFLSTEKLLKNRRCSAVVEKEEKGYLVPLPARRLIKVSGPDAAAFLQGIVTQDVRRLQPTPASPGFLSEFRHHLQQSPSEQRTKKAKTLQQPLLLQQRVLQLLLGPQQQAASPGDCTPGHHQDEDAGKEEEAEEEENEAVAVSPRLQHQQQQQHPEQVLQQQEEEEQRQQQKELQANGMRQEQQREEKDVLGQRQCTERDAQKPRNTAEKTKKEKRRNLPVLAKLVGAAAAPFALLNTQGRVLVDGHLLRAPPPSGDLLLSSCCNGSAAPFLSSPLADSELPRGAAVAARTPHSSAPAAAAATGTPSPPTLAAAASSGVLATPPTSLSAAQQGIAASAAAPAAAASSSGEETGTAATQRRTCGDAPVTRQQQQQDLQQLQQQEQQLQKPEEGGGKEAAVGGQQRAREGHATKEEEGDVFLLDIHQTITERLFNFLQRRKLSSRVKIELLPKQQVLVVQLLPPVYQAFSLASPAIATAAASAASTESAVGSPAAAAVAAPLAAAAATPGNAAAAACEAAAGGDARGEQGRRGKSDREDSQRTGRWRSAGGDASEPEAAVHEHPATAAKTTCVTPAALQQQHPVQQQLQQTQKRKNKKKQQTLLQYCASLGKQIRPGEVYCLQNLTQRRDGWLLQHRAAVSLPLLPEHQQQQQLACGLGTAAAATARQVAPPQNSQRVQSHASFSSTTSTAAHCSSTDCSNGSSSGNSSSSSSKRSSGNGSSSNDVNCSVADGSSRTCSNNDGSNNRSQGTGSSYSGLTATERCSCDSKSAGEEDKKEKESVSSLFPLVVADGRSWRLGFRLYISSYYTDALAASSSSGAAIDNTGTLHASPCSSAVPAALSPAAQLASRSAAGCFPRAAVSAAAALAVEARSAADRVTRCNSSSTSSGIDKWAAAEVLLPHPTAQNNSTTSCLLYSSFSPSPHFSLKSTASFLAESPRRPQATERDASPAAALHLFSPTLDPAAARTPAAAVASSPGAPTNSSPFAAAGGEGAAAPPATGCDRPGAAGVAAAAAPPSHTSLEREALEYHWHSSLSSPSSPLSSSKQYSNIRSAAVPAAPASSCSGHQAPGEAAFSPAYLVRRPASTASSSCVSNPEDATGAAAVCSAGAAAVAAAVAISLPPADAALPRAPAAAPPGVSAAFDFPLAASPPRLGLLAAPFAASPSPAASLRPAAAVCPADSAASSSPPAVSALPCRSPPPFAAVGGSPLPPPAAAACAARAAASLAPAESGACVPAAAAAAFLPRVLLSPTWLYRAWRLLLAVAEGPDEVGVQQQLLLPVNYDWQVFVHPKVNKGCFIGQEVVTRSLLQLSNRRRLASFVVLQPQPRLQEIWKGKVTHDAAELLVRQREKEENTTGCFSSMIRPPAPVDAAVALPRPAAQKAAAATRKNSSAVAEDGDTATSAAMLPSIEASAATTTGRGGEGPERRGEKEVEAWQSAAAGAISQLFGKVPATATWEHLLQVWHLLLTTKALEATATAARADTEGGEAAAADAGGGVAAVAGGAAADTKSTAPHEENHCAASHAGATPAAASAAAASAGGGGSEGRVKRKLFVFEATAAAAGERGGEREGAAAAGAPVRPAEAAAGRHESERGVSCRGGGREEATAGGDAGGGNSKQKQEEEHVSAAADSVLALRSGSPQRSPAAAGSWREIGEVFLDPPCSLPDAAAGEAGKTAATAGLRIEEAGEDGKRRGGTRGANAAAGDGRDGGAAAAAAEFKLGVGLCMLRTKPGQPPLKSLTEYLSYVSSLGTSSPYPVALAEKAADLPLLLPPCGEGELRRDGISSEEENRGEETRRCHPESQAEAWQTGRGGAAAANTPQKTAEGTSLSATEEEQQPKKRQKPKKIEWCLVGPTLLALDRWWTAEE